MVTSSPVFMPDIFLYHKTHALYEEINRDTVSK